jgi:hypothetical protein
MTMIDHEDGIPIQPDCTLCLSQGTQTPETLIHIFVQYSGAARLTHLRLKINNVFRQYLRLSVHSDYDAREQLMYLTEDDPDIQPQPGWTRVLRTSWIANKLEKRGPRHSPFPGQKDPDGQTGC